MQIINNLKNKHKFRIQIIPVNAILSRCYKCIEEKVEETSSSNRTQKCSDYSPSGVFFPHFSYSQTVSHQSTLKLFLSNLNTCPLQFTDLLYSNSAFADSGKSVLLDMTNELWRMRRQISRTVKKGKTLQFAIEKTTTVMRRRVSFLKSKLLKQMAVEHNQMLIVHIFWMRFFFRENHSN